MHTVYDVDKIYTCPNLRNNQISPRSQQNWNTAPKTVEICLDTKRDKHDSVVPMRWKK